MSTTRNWTEQEPEDQDYQKKLKLAVPSQLHQGSMPWLLPHPLSHFAREHENRLPQAPRKMPRWKVVVHHQADG